MATAAEVVAHSFEAFNRHDLEGFIACYADDMTFASSSGEQLQGKVAWRERTAPAFAMMPDIRIELGKCIADGSSVAVEWTFRGTATNPIQMPDGGPLLPATGKSMAVPVATVYEVRGGLIASEHEYMDTGAMYAQLGLA